MKHMKFVIYGVASVQIWSLGTGIFYLISEKYGQGIFGVTLGVIGLFLVIKTFMNMEKRHKNGQKIVEASRNLLRDLGFQWNFAYSQSPQTGNATGSNFPNTVVAGGGVASGAGLQAINFPAAVSQSAGAGIAGSDQHL